MDTQFDISNLSPAEKDDLLMELVGRYKSGDTGSSGPTASAESGGSDGNYHDICQLLEMLIDKVEEIDERSTKLEHAVIDDLFGGIERMYKDNLKVKGVGEIKAKYGEMFAPHMDVLKQTDPDSDIFEMLHNQREDMRGSDGYSDEMFDGKVAGYAQAIAEKIAELKANGTIPAGAEVEVKVDGVVGGGGESEELSPAQKLVRSVRDKNKALGRDFKQI
jgi:hypothetical protein